MTRPAVAIRRRESLLCRQLPNFAPTGTFDTFVKGQKGDRQVQSNFFLHLSIHGMGLTETPI